MRRKRPDGLIYHWQLSPARIVGQPVRVLDERRKPNLPMWDDHFLDTADIMEAITRTGQHKGCPTHPGAATGRGLE
jgi:hypothetical protein